jgi:hypothetical protein
MSSENIAWETERNRWRVEYAVEHGVWLPLYEGSELVSTPLWHKLHRRIAALPDFVLLKSNWDRTVEYFQCPVHGSERCLFWFWRMQWYWGYSIPFRIHRLLSERWELNLTFGEELRYVDRSVIW